MFGGDNVFLGNDGQECEEFIRAIHNAAYAGGKIRDDAWMADLALTYFSGRALRYYDSLEPEVKRDWSLLRQALLARYPPLDDDENEAQPRGLRMPRTPILMEGQIPSRTGRIRVIGVNSVDSGYLGNGETAITTSLGAGASATEALSFCYKPGRGLSEIEIRCQNGKSQVLGLHWEYPSPSTAMGSINYAGLTAFDCEGTRRSRKHSRNGPGQTRIWKVMSDNTVCPHLEDDESLKSLQLFVCGNSGRSRAGIDASADPGAFLTKYGSGWKPVKLVFEHSNEGVE